MSRDESSPERNPPRGGGGGGGGAAGAPPVHAPPPTVGGGYPPYPPPPEGLYPPPPPHHAGPAAYDPYGDYADYPPPAQAPRAPPSDGYAPRPPPAPASRPRRPAPASRSGAAGGGRRKHQFVSGGRGVHSEPVVLRKKFSWRNYPELEEFLVGHRQEYLRHSALNYTAEQKHFNNRLTEGLLELAARLNYVFDESCFNFVAVRDRIRCYYKSYVQSSKKRGVVVANSFPKRAIKGEGGGAAEGIKSEM